MVELIAEGSEAAQRWRREVPVGEVCVLGRDPALPLPIPWDRAISRHHAEVMLQHGVLVVRKLEGAVNPIFFGGEVVESCEVRVGEHFVIGNTRFLLIEASSQPSVPSSAPVEEVTFTREALQHVRFRDADKRIEVLSHLPEVIWGARTDSELLPRLVNLLMAGIASSEAAALVGVESDGEVKVLHWDRRRETAGAFRPSSRLVTEAVLRRRQSTLHVWDSPESQTEFTAMQESDWAFCTPVPGPPGERWGLYLAGRLEARSPRLTRDSRPLQSVLPDKGTPLQADVKFAELVAEIVGSVRRLRHLERQQAGLRQFLPSVIVSTLSDEANMSLLAPRESDVTVLFCDLRGFSRQTEEARGNLIAMLDRVSHALGVMTHHILANGGVIGDFQGDAAMGFWGWPVAQPDSALQACRAALAIRRDFTAAAGQPGNLLADFEMGIGMAHGRAVAGRIGTSEHMEVTVFGPVVNLASRLEGMTKQLRVPILIDESLAVIVRDHLDPRVGRLRHLAQVLPYGLDTPVFVSELLPSEVDDPTLTAAHLAAYEAAVAHFIAGQWEEAYRELRHLPPNDRAQDFLAVLIAQHNRVAPPDWNGIVRLPSK